MEAIFLVGAIPGAAVVVSLMAAPKMQIPVQDIGPALIHVFKEIEAI